MHIETPCITSGVLLSLQPANVSFSKSLQQNKFSSEVFGSCNKNSKGLCLSLVKDTMKQFYFKLEPAINKNEKR